MLHNPLAFRSAVAAQAPDILKNIHLAFTAATGWTIHIGAELEFYLLPSSSDFTLPPSASLAPLIHAACIAHHVPVYGMTEERGPNQHELQLPPTADVLALAAQIERARAAITAVASTHGHTASFAGSPLENAPGSAVHYHVHITDAKGVNLCVAEKDGSLPPLFQYVIGGLCATMAESMLLFVPKEHDYVRFTHPKETPTTISWGGNNRTTALRLPPTPPGEARFEHRVPSANCCPYLSLSALIIGCHYGAAAQVLPPSRIYGNAFDPQYQASMLPLTFEEALTTWQESKIVVKALKKHLVSS